MFVRMYGKEKLGADDRGGCTVRAIILKHHLCILQAETVAYRSFVSTTVHEKKKNNCRLISQFEVLMQDG